MDISYFFSKYLMTHARIQNVFVCFMFTGEGSVGPYQYS